MDTQSAYNSILQKIKQKDYAPLYLLHGEESYYIDQLCRYMEQNILSEEERSFNQMVFYGKDSTAQEIIETARRFPMMAERLVVILKEAQDLKDLEKMEAYVKAPPATTLMLICHKHKSLDKRTKLFKALKDKAVILESKPLYDNQVPGWISQFLSSQSLKAEAGIPEMLAEYLGNDLAKISRELSKVMVNLKDEKTLTRKHVEESIGISKDYNVFELQKAIGQRNALKAQRIVQYFSYNPRAHPMVLTVGTLYSYFAKLVKIHQSPSRDPGAIAKLIGVHSFFAREYLQAAQNYSQPQAVRAISLLRTYDLRSKGEGNVSATDGELLRELVFKIMHS